MRHADAIAGVRHETKCPQRLFRAEIHSASANGGPIIHGETLWHFRALGNGGGALDGSNTNAVPTRLEVRLRYRCETHSGFCCPGVQSIGPRRFVSDEYHVKSTKLGLVSRRFHLSCAEGSCQLVKVGHADAWPAVIYTNEFSQRTFSAIICRASTIVGVIIDSETPLSSSTLGERVAAADGQVRREGSVVSASFQPHLRYTRKNRVCRATPGIQRFHRRADVLDQHLVRITIAHLQHTGVYVEKPRLRH
mmetsp:Transcript_11690/g.31481  ORF Transcript_11690/g.31481 Transcript_11690/m.31481 type:complete len:250 (+) Transcript_11690:521-1270(+)